MVFISNVNAIRADTHSQTKMLNNRNIIVKNIMLLAKTKRATH